MASTQPAIVEFDPFSIETLNDPYPAYHELQDEEPLHWSAIWGVWVVSRYDDVQGVLQDSRFSARHSVEQLGVKQEVDLGLFGKVSTLPSTDPPAHTRLRKLVNKAFTPAGVEQLRQQVEAIVEQRLGAASERGELHLVEDLAGPLPTLAIARLLGVPEADAPLFKKWSNDLLVAFEGYRATPEQLAAASRAGREFEEYLRHEVRTRKGVATDLLVRLREASVEGDFLTEDEVLSTCMLLLIAGNETTTSLIANGMYALFEHPHELARLQEDRSFVPSAVEEFLRYYGPVQMSLRKATEDIGIAGGTIPKGQSVAALLGAADRDPRQFPDPDALKVDRRPNQHLAFGRGRHFCLGASLARLEAQVVFRRIVDQFDHLEFVNDVESKWTGSMQARRINEVALRVRAK